MFLANGHLPRVSCLLANDKGANDVEIGAVHRSLGIYLTAEESPGKPQLEDYAASHCFGWAHYLQMMSVGSYSMSGRKKKPFVSKIVF